GGDRSRLRGAYGGARALARRGRFRSGVGGAGRIQRPQRGLVPAVDVRSEGDLVPLSEILGEVNKPGEYPYSNGLTVDKAVATANGYTYRANTKKVFIKRAD